ncbi:MAG: magnesium transporter CorA family protein [Stenotrophobium sp.]
MRKPYRREPQPVQIYHFANAAPPRLLDSTEPLPQSGLIWIDILREEAQNWACTVEPMAGCAIEAQHVADSLNPDHPSFFDGTADYDMLVFQGLGPRDDTFPLETRTAVFFLLDRMLVSVRGNESVSFGLVHQKLADGRLKPPGSILKLTHLVLDAMVDRFLRVREPMDRRFTALQDELLAPHGSVDDWRTLLDERRVARQLEALCDDQLEALDAWRRNTRTDWSSTEEIRIRDLIEHIDRVEAHAGAQGRDIEAAVQLHFAALTHRTNEIMKVFTVAAVVFMPLTLLTGIWGMNFEYMPELHFHYAYFVALGSLVVLGGLMLYIFKRKGYF